MPRSRLGNTIPLGLGSTPPTRQISEIEEEPKDMEHLSFGKCLTREANQSAARQPSKLMDDYLRKTKESNAYTDLKDDASKEAFKRVAEMQWRSRRLAAGQSVLVKTVETTQRSRPWNMSDEDFQVHVAQRHSPTMTTSYDRTVLFSQWCGPHLFS